MDEYATVFGFTFGSFKDIYNPWSVLNFLDTGRYGTYWANTSSNSLVGKIIRESGVDVKLAFEKLLCGETICCSIDEQIVYDQLDKKRNAILSLLLASGYLKVIRFEQVNEVGDKMFPDYEFALTNREVRYMFLQMARDWFDESGSNYTSFVKALLIGDKKAMNVYMNRMTPEIFSYFDTGKHPSEQELERFYHGFAFEGKKVLIG